MFEITPDDIASLNDEDLRTLVGLLCEAVVRSKGFPISSVTWGGDQNAKDGGIDVRVELPEGGSIGGFVPRARTGFQVKKPDLSPSSIEAEMRPKGVLRPAIRDLADRSGSYVIISGESSTSDLALQGRRNSMSDAVGDIPNAASLGLDFYDGRRLTSWVGEHAGLVLWVRQRTGRSLRGWRPYGTWANAPEGLDGEYLLDSNVRIRRGAVGGGGDGGLHPLQGISVIRDALRNPGGVVRLIGLSGVGKTRLVQALFDSRIGINGLDPTAAAYTNVSDDPEPQPAALVSDLIATRTRAIVIVDNCPPDLHRTLSNFCQSTQGSVSLITIEYDIREDQPEGTEVFELEPSSADLIERLVARRFPHISQVDSHSIAEFSGGNARIAIALAQSLDRNESLAGMSDEDLFQRLFQQRNDSNESLLRAAEALSLVYSFQGEDVSVDNQSELFRLGALVDKQPNELFQGIAELERRGLVQRRGVWRAVLPQAIANRLAARALQNIPATAVDARMVNGAPRRLLKSFSRRLGYLHSSPEARRIGQLWLAAGGWLHCVSHLDDLGRAVLYNVAPVAPDAVLTAFEEALSDSQSQDELLEISSYAQILRSLAYEPRTFDRCAALLSGIAEAQDVSVRSNETSKLFASLFTIHFSGTHATIEQRLSVVDTLAGSSNAKLRTLGLAALKSMLKTSHFSPAQTFQFGARSRDYGYWPRRTSEVKQWFGETLKLAGSLALLDAPPAAEARSAIADAFRGLWHVECIHDDLECLCEAIGQRQFWADGWVAVRQTIFYDSKGMTPEAAERLARLEKALRPADLVQKVRSIVLSEEMLYVGWDLVFEPDDSVGRPMSQVEQMALDLGKAAVVHQVAFAEVLPDLLKANSQQTWQFGRGLATGSEAPQVTWRQIVRGLASVPTESQSPTLLSGFIAGLRSTSAELVNLILDDAVEDETLRAWYPLLQSAAGIDADGLNRLMLSLERGTAPIGMYRQLVAGGVTHMLSGRDFNKLLLRITERPGGWTIATEILSMRLSSVDGHSQSSDAEIVDIGCELLRRLEFTERRGDSLEWRLRIIMESCLVDKQGEDTVREICRKMMTALSKAETYAFCQRDLLRALLRTQPLIVLEAICGDDEARVNVLDEADVSRSHLLDAVPERHLLSWCDERPETRYPLVAGLVTAFRQSDRASSPQWTDIARKLMDRAPNRIQVLKRFIAQFSPTGWVGSEATILQANATLLDQFAPDEDPSIREFVATEKIRLARVVASIRQVEISVERRQNETFE